MEIGEGRLPARSFRLLAEKFLQQSSCFAQAIVVGQLPATAG
jgi:hypothetical protein